MVGHCAVHIGPRLRNMLHNKERKIIAFSTTHNNKKSKKEKQHPNTFTRPHSILNKVSEWSLERSSSVRWPR